MGTDSSTSPWNSFLGGGEEGEVLKSRGRRSIIPNSEVQNNRETQLLTSQIQLQVFCLFKLHSIQKLQVPQSLVRMSWGFIQVDLYMVVPVNLFVLFCFKSVLSIMLLYLLFSFSVLKVGLHLHPAAVCFIPKCSHSRTHQGQLRREKTAVGGSVADEESCSADPQVQTVFRRYPWRLKSNPI